MLQLGQGHSIEFLKKEHTERYPLCMFLNLFNNCLQCRFFTVIKHTIILHSVSFTEAM